jgi:8-oxo-dGTP pyrophosphatase MutT (NUDIX family)
MRRLAEGLRTRLATRERSIGGYPDFRPAAVLVPILSRQGEPHLLFTLRSAELSVHSGQVSFPGGKCEARDAGPAATALREAEEELGISPASVEVLGLLDEVATPSGFVITPVVGLLADGIGGFQPRQGEVAEVFDVALAVLADPRVFEDHGDFERDGRLYRLCSYRVAGRNVWGATARMVRQLLELRD